MSIHIKSCMVAFLVVFGVISTQAVNQFVVANDENGQVYVADWVVASNQFVNFRHVFSTRRSEGEGVYCRGVVTGDFDGDGDNDIISARRIYHNRVAIHLLLNDGSNNFVFSEIIGFPFSFSDWVMDGCAGDFNSDGIDDFTFKGTATAHSKPRSIIPTPVMIPMA